MKKNIFIILIPFAVSLLLASCSSGSDDLPSSTPFIVENPILPVTPTLEYGCSTISAQPTSAAGNGFAPLITSADFSIGPADASVTLMEYCDFQSEGCAGMFKVVTELMKNHEDMRFVFRPLPLIDILDKSDKAVIAALAAEEQGQFWEMYNLLFEKRNEWAGLNPNKFYDWVVEQAVSVGMNGERLSAAINDPRTTTRMMSMYESAKSLNIAAVPLTLINNEPFYLLDYRNLSDTISLIELGRRQFSDCPPFSIDRSKQYIATIQTEKGNIVIELYPNKAPLTVNSFVFLAGQGWFDGVTFHRVIPGFVAQTGDPSGTGRGNPGYFFANETSGLLFDQPGRVAMTNSGFDANGSQFFITFTPQPLLDGGYTIFGQVLSGLDVAEQLTPRDPDHAILEPPGDKIITITIEEK